MRSLIIAMLIIAVTAAGGQSQPVAGSGDIPELSSILSLFTAQATSNHGVRLNWILDRQSPTILKFRIYRGYEEVGNFAVLTELASHTEADTVDYLYKDTTALPGVSYYYKLAALGQSSESVFPVVITATPPLAGQSPGERNVNPAGILAGDKIVLYVRTKGRVTLSISDPLQKSLVNDVLRPGIYEFDLPGEIKGKAMLQLDHESGYSKSIAWPLP